MSPSRPPPVLAQMALPEGETAIITKLDDTADHLLESLNPLLPTADESGRHSRIAATLTTIARTQQKLGLPPESPAIITDPAGTVVAASWAHGVRTADPGRPSVIACLQSAAQKAGQHQLDDLGYTLHLIGSVEHFDAPGAIYNFGPSCVHLISLEGFTSRYEPVAAYFWDEADKKRGMRVIASPATSEEGLEASKPRVVGRTCSCIIPSSLNADTHHSQPPFLQEILASWKKRPLPLNTSPRDGIAPDSAEARELMRDLHRAACHSVLEGGGPFAAAIVSPKGEVLSVGVNRVVAEQDAIAHGEVCALREARRVLLEDNPGAQHPEKVLSGYSVVTSSITCISCAEQIARYGIKQLFYDNSKDDIERNTPFTEGPLRADFWHRTGIIVARIATEDSLRLEPFRLFSQGLTDGSVISYLKDKARVTIHPDGSH